MQQALDTAALQQWDHHLSLPPNRCVTLWATSAGKAAQIWGCEESGTEIEFPPGIPRSLEWGSVGSSAVLLGDTRWRLWWLSRRSAEWWGWGPAAAEMRQTCVKSHKNVIARQGSWHKLWRVTSINSDWFAETYTREMHKVWFVPSSFQNSSANLNKNTSASTLHHDLHTWSKYLTQRELKSSNL